MPKPHLGGLTVEETALKKNTVRARNKSSVQWRPVGIEKRKECDSIEACLWLMSIHVRTSTYQYVPICTWITWTLHFLKFNIILLYLLHRSCTLLYHHDLTLRELPGCMRKPHVLFKVRTGTYQYVLVCKSCTDMYQYVLVSTSTYQYVPFCLILSRCTGFQISHDCQAFYFLVAHFKAKLLTYHHWLQSAPLDFKSQAAPGEVLASLRIEYGMVPVSPTGKRASLPNIDVTSTGDCKSS